METGRANTFPKSEKLCGKTSIASLMEGGHWGSSAHLRYCWKRNTPLTEVSDAPADPQTVSADPHSAPAGTQTVSADPQTPPADTQPAPAANRLVISVPKKFFKRAVKRNLLKRRIREAYRLNKSHLPQSGIDMLFVWSSAEVGEFAIIAEEVTAILQRIASKI